MKTKLFIVLALTIVLLPAMAQPEAASTEADQAITQLREGLVNSFNQGDIDRLLTFLDTNAVVTWQNGEVCEGTAAVKAYYDRMMKGDRPVVSKVTSDPKDSRPAHTGRLGNLLGRVKRPLPADRRPRPAVEQPLYRDHRQTGRTVESFRLPRFSKCLSQSDNDVGD